MSPDTSEKPCYEVKLYDPEAGTQAFLVIDTLTGGFAAGGIRLSPTVTLEEVQELARTMTRKFRLLKIPLGGAKAGIVADPASPQKEAHLRAFARLAEPFLKELYIAGEDLGTTARDVALVYREAGCSWFDVVSQRGAERFREAGIPLDALKGLRPTDLEGVNLEEVLTGFGIAEVTEEACLPLGFEPGECRVSMQGFGTVGGAAARYLAEKGFRLVAVADARGVLYHENGLPVEELLAARDELGLIDRGKLSFPLEERPREEWLRVEADVLIPAAISGAVHEGNVQEIHPNVRLVVEAANLPLTPGAERALFERGVVVIPDFLANAGAAGGFGMLLTAQVPPDPMRVLAELKERLRAVTREVLAESKQRGCPPREAAEALARP